ncbi:hypothetical protein KC352_g31216, partial [Hortaea werneckii]
MEALLRQSRAMCPFLNKTSPATLRSMSMSTSTNTSVHSAAPGGGAMSNLQIIARRCPVMGKALSVQSSRVANSALSGAFGGTRAYHAKVPRARLHTNAPNQAQAHDIPAVRRDHAPFSPPMSRAQPAVANAQQHQHQH